MKLVLVLCILVSMVLGAQCNKKDKQIFKRIGHEFSHRFRAFGGVTVSKTSYENAVHKATGLSTPCSQCYGDAYICGYNNCFWSCSTEGSSCDNCLQNEGCISSCNKCTGFTPVEKKKKKTKGV